MARSTHPRAEWARSTHPECDAPHPTGALVKPDQSAACNDALFAQLGSTRAATRKRAISCIAALSAALPDKLLAQLVA